LLLFSEYRKKYGVFLKLLPLLLLSLSVLIARQFPHYIQLVAPWSYLALAAMTAGLPFNKIDTGRIYLVQRIFIILAICTFAGSASGIMSHPFDKLALMRKEQELFVKPINQVLPKGDSVFVVMNPAAYVFCDFYSPIHDYGFGIYKKIFQDNALKHLCKINNIIVFYYKTENDIFYNYKSKSPHLDDNWWEQRGFRKIDTTGATLRLKSKLRYSIYKRVSPCI
jgi:hypothetical protein